MENFRGFEAASHRGRHFLHYQLKAIGHPTVRSEFFIFTPVTEFDPVGVEVVKKSASLVFTNVESRESDQSAGVVTRIHDFGRDTNNFLVTIGFHLQLGDIESELIEFAHLFFQCQPIGAGELNWSCDRVPQRVVPGAQAHAGHNRVDTFLQAIARSQIHEFAGNIDCRGLQVIFPLAV